MSRRIRFLRAASPRRPPGGCCDVMHDRAAFPLARSMGWTRRIPRSLHLEIFGRGLAPVGDQFVLDLLALVERAQPGALDRRHMHEDIFPPFRRLYEAVAFGRVEPLDSSASHYRSPGS